MTVHKKLTAEGAAAIEAGQKVIELLRPLNEHQRSWAVAIALAEFVVTDDPAFVQRVAYMLQRNLHKRLMRGN
jgi:hypothetical protein